MNKFIRSTLFRTNKLQRIFFYPIVFSFFLGCSVAWLSLVYFLIGEHLFNPDLDKLQEAIPILLSLAAIMMIVIVFWTARISNRYFGSHDRILKDFDKILSGESKGPLETRKGDVVLAEFVKRVNTLIEK